MHKHARIQSDTYEAIIHDSFNESSKQSQKKGNFGVLDFYLSQAARRLTPEILILNSNFAGHSNPNLLYRPVRNQKERYFSWNSAFVGF